MSSFVEQNKILECLTGSRAYGTNREDSDYDYRGITMEPLDCYLGLGSFGQYTDPKEDRIIYGFKKFIQLACKCNPNIIEILFMPDKHIVHITPVANILRENANLFLSKHAKHTFSGYAISQLKRIERHNRWLTNSPIQPNPKDFVKQRYMILCERDGAMMPTKVAQDVWEETLMKSRWTEIHTEGYEPAKKEWDLYQKWLKERNPARAALEEKFGYDTKHAAHLVRLFHMGEEILKTGKVIVDRRDAGDHEELIAIKNGSMSFDEILEFATNADAAFEQLYEDSPLPYAVDEQAINDLCTNLVSHFHKQEISTILESNNAFKVAGEVE